MAKQAGHKLKADTALMREYAGSLRALDRQAEKLEAELKVLFPEGAPELRLEALTEGRADVEKCVRYLADTASELEALERKLAGRF